MASISFGPSLAISSARREASTAIEVWVVPSATQWRLWIPVGWRIHSSLVSITLERSSFVTTRSGRKLPVPRMIERGIVGWVEEGGNLAAGAGGRGGGRGGAAGDEQSHV